MTEPVVVDFETKGIQPRPHFPPVPVGVAILENGASEYFAWGHPTGNNTTREIAAARLKGIWMSGRPVLFHNAAFDLEVAYEHFGLPYPPAGGFFDSKLELFLFDPHAESLGLKPAATTYLHQPPDEKDALREHLIERGVIRKNMTRWEAHISEGDGAVVGAYAIGDVVRTKGLHDAFFPAFDSRMATAYRRELALLPLLIENSRQGMRVDVPKLERALAFYEAEFRRADEWLYRRLGRTFNVDADAEVAEALRAAGVVTEFAKTKTGRDSVSKKNLGADRFTDREVFAVLGWRQRLATCLSTFIRPWLEGADKDGNIHTTWNQVRGEAGGARTGRMSCHPNFQNVPKDWTDKGDGFVQPEGFAELPKMRQFLLPDPGHIWLHRDYNQQELRILAHFEGDVLQRAYLDNPRMDLHTYVQQEIERVTGLHLERRAVKILNFGMLYGMGLDKLAGAMGVSREQASVVRQAQRRALPGLVALEEGLRARAREGRAVRTWGGRSYYCEPPKELGGRMRTFEYKLLNYLVQGSAADCTKQALLNYDAMRKYGRLIVTVHDEINVSVPEAAMTAESKILAHAMESVPFDVPMLSDAKYGPNWAQLEKENA